MGPRAVDSEIINDFGASRVFINDLLAFRARVVDRRMGAGAARMTTGRLVYVEIVTHEVPERIEKRTGPMSVWQADKVERGVNINLNHERFYTRQEPEHEP